MRMHCTAAAALIASCVAGCTLLVSLDGLSESGGAGPDAAGPDTTGTDGTAGDAGLPHDAALDSAPDAFGCPGSGAAVCEDFDVGDPLSRWSPIVTSNAALTLATDLFRSAPRALRSSVSSGSDGRFAYLGRELAESGTVSSARMSYSLYVEQRPTTGELEVGLLRFTGKDGLRSEFYVAVGKDASFLVEQTIPDGGPLDNKYEPIGDAITAGKWQRVDIDVSIAGTKRMSIRVDGIEILQRSLVWAAPGLASAFVGITYAGTNVTGALLVDDVVVELLP